MISTWSPDFGKHALFWCCQHTWKAITNSFFVFLNITFKQTSAEGHTFEDDQLKNLLTNQLEYLEIRTKPNEFCILPNAQELMDVHTSVLNNITRYIQRRTVRATIPDGATLIMHYDPNLSNLFQQNTSKYLTYLSKLSENQGTLGNGEIETD